MEYDQEEIELYDSYIKFANRLIKDELKIREESIEVINIEKPIDQEEWVFTVKKFSYNKAKLSKKFQKYLAWADSSEIKELMMPSYVESLHTIRMMSYHKWKMMVQRDKRLHELLKNNNI